MIPFPFSRGIMFLLHLLFLTFATASLSSLSAKWCNDYFCLDASSSLAEITYALTARVDDLGWIAVGTGCTMDGSKMFLLYPAPDGTCVLSERDGVSPPFPPSLTRSLTLCTARLQTPGNHPATNLPSPPITGKHDAPHMPLFPSRLCSPNTAKQHHRHGHALGLLFHAAEYHLFRCQYQTTRRVWDL